MIKGIVTNIKNAKTNRMIDFIRNHYNELFKKQGQEEIDIPFFIKTEQLIDTIKKNGIVKEVYEEIKKGERQAC